MYILYPLINVVVIVSACAENPCRPAGTNKASICNACLAVYPERKPVNRLLVIYH